MALRFQKGRDEVDQEVKEERSIPLHLFVFVLLASIVGVVSWVSGESLHSYEGKIVFIGVCAWVFWMVFPLYSEFRIRTKEIYGMVSEIEKAISGTKEDHKELLKRLSAIEDELRLLR